MTFSKYHKLIDFSLESQAEEIRWDNTEFHKNFICKWGDYTNSILHLMIQSISLTMHNIKYWKTETVSDKPITINLVRFNQYLIIV